MDYRDRLEWLYDELVPASGAAETKAGELVRAVIRIGYRFYNDGDKIGVEYGNETCNAAARFIIDTYPEFEGIINSMWGMEYEDAYEIGYFRLEEKTVKYIHAHPELKSEENDDDYWKHFLPEDRWYEEEDDECDDEYDDEVSTTFAEPWAVYDPDPAWED